MINLLNKYTGFISVDFFFQKKNALKRGANTVTNRSVLERGPFLRSEITDSNNTLPIFLFELSVV